MEDKNEIFKDMHKVALSSVYGKTVKSYALDTETIEAIDRISTDLGIKSRSETLREIVKRYDEWQNQKSISEN